jgi:uncharacterized membrane protein
MSIAARVLAGVTIAAAGIAYALAAHFTSAATDAGNWAVFLAGAPIALAVGAFTHRRLGILPLILALAGLAILAAWAFPILQKNVGTLYFLQHVTVNGFLCTLFARTLSANLTPLCTVFARHTRQHMSEAVVLYTRRVTQAWALFFATVTAASVLLFSLAPIEIWSGFANLMTPLLVLLMFVGEYLVRRRILPRDEHRSFLATFRAYRATMRQDSAAVGVGPVDGVPEAGRP